MNTLSTRTLGHLIRLTADNMSTSDIRTMLMQSGIYDALGPDSADLLGRFSDGQEIMRVPLLDAGEMARRGNEDAHDALLRLVRLGAELVVQWFNDAEQKLSQLREALLGDGYELRVSGPAAGWDTDVSGAREVQVLPVDPDAVPVTTEITALQAELDARGYTEASEHYRLSVKHFTEQDHPSSNGQLRNMIESLVTRLAADHTGYKDTKQSGQGGAAINTLYTVGGKPPAIIGQALPENDGGRMLHGIWNVLHSNGPHPGLSDADEARIRMQLCTALARFLLKHFPAKP